MREAQGGGPALAVQTKESPFSEERGRFCVREIVVNSNNFQSGLENFSNLFI